MTVAVSDGERLYAARYASGPVVNSLFVSADASAVRALYPDDARFQQFSDEARAVVSEPLGDLPGLWHEVPPAPRSWSSPATTIKCRSRRGPSDGSRSRAVRRRHAPAPARHGACWATGRPARVRRRRAACPTRRTP